MRFKLTVAALLPFVLVLAACGGPMPEESAAPPPPADPAEIDALRAAFAAAYAAGNAATIASMYAEDAVYLPDHQPAIAGRAAIQQHFEQVFSVYSTALEIMPADTEITGDVAHEHGTFSVTLTPKAGGDAMTETGKYLVLFERGPDGMWRLHHDMENSSDPEPGTAP